MIQDTNLLYAKNDDEKELQYSLVQKGRKYEIKINVNNTNIMKFSKKSSNLTKKIRNTHLVQIKEVNYGVWHSNTSYRMFKRFKVLFYQGSPS